MTDVLTVSPSVNSKAALLKHANIVIVVITNADLSDLGTINKCLVNDNYCFNCYNTSDYSISL